MSDDDYVLFRDVGGYMSDEQPDYNMDGCNDDTEGNEGMLREAIRLFNESQGNMPNIDFERIQTNVEHALGRYSGGVQGDALEDEDDECSGTESEEMAMAMGQALSIAKGTARRRSASARPINYNENAMDTDGPADFIPDSLVDDDEDSNYEGSDDDVSSSGDDEYHMMDYQASVEEAAGFSRRSRRRKGHKKSKRDADPVYSKEVQNMLGAANVCYVDHKLEDAYSRFCEAIRLDPTCAIAWKTMAMIREEQGRNMDAQHLNILAAHVAPKDTGLWDQLCSRFYNTAVECEEAAKAGDPVSKSMLETAAKNALFCLSFIVRYRKHDDTTLRRKLDILKLTGNYKAMAGVYRTMLKADPYNMDIIRQATLVYTKCRNDVDTPIKWFTGAFAFYNDQAVKATEECVAQLDARWDGRGKGARADNPGSGSDFDSDDDGEIDSDGGWAEYYRSNPGSTIPMDEVGGYTYSDINMLAELRILRQDYRDAIADVKRGARFIQGRGRTKRWAGKEVADQNDLEYAPSPVPSGDETHNTLPIELRVRLGQCRLLLGQVDEAKAHFECLFASGVSGYQDLFADVGETYMDYGDFESAIKVYDLMRTCPEADEPLTWDKLAKCYREVQDLTKACEYANMVVEADENHVQMLMLLGDLYEEMGLFDKAMAAINKAEKAEERIREAENAEAAILKSRADAAEASKALARDDVLQLLPTVEIWEQPNPAVQTDIRKPAAKFLKRQMDENDETRRHVAAMRTAETSFRKLDLLKPQIDKDQDPLAVAEYCNSANRLYVDWTRIHAFYLTDRTKPFRGYRNHLLTGLENGKKSGGVDLDSNSAGQVAVRRELDARRRRISKKQNPKNAHFPDDKDEASRPTTFRGISFDRWYNMFLMYGKCLSLSGNAEGAIKALEKVADSSVYHHDRDRVRTIRVLILAIALKGNTICQFYTQAHWWCGTKPTSAIVYKLVAYLMTTSVGAMTMLTATNMYKFMRRQLEQIDDIYYKNRESNEVPIPEDLPIFGDTSDLSNQVVGQNGDHRTLTRNDLAAVHTMTAHIMTVARPENASMTQYSMALALVPRDASLALHTGVSYMVHGAKHGRSKHDTNHQKTMLKGLMYLERYAELRCIEEKRAAGEYDGNWADGHDGRNAVVTQEIAYNFARAFQFIGLSELAVEYYRRTLSLPISRLAASGDGEEESMCDLRREAAYNLAMLYISSGAVLKARDVLQKYCTID
ncbi:transcription factor TFIIIC subunit tfc4 [Coemansia sp. BCRC 34301]|nr:transcription factor TFIIIC subunit tfc4 [Coemansia sp. BCRC 34301]